MKGRIYRRCHCVDHNRRPLGTNCPQLTDDKHGTWSFAVDLPSLDGKRKTMRRGGFATKREAQSELKKVHERVDSSVKTDDRETVAQYLTKWLSEKRHTLKPRTLFGYSEFVHKRINPHIGTIKLEQLRHEHVVRLVDTLIEEGRGPSTIKSVLAVLRSALSDAVRHKRLTHNAAQHVQPPAYRAPERQPWTAAQAAQFLDHIHDDRLAPLFEVLIGTGLRRGEVLALQWEDVDLDNRILRVRRSVTDVKGKLVIGAPKTKASAGWVGLSTRMVAVFERQRANQGAERAMWGEAYEDNDLVFARENGAMLRPEYVLKRFHALSETAGLPLVRLHDLRHLAASLMLQNGVPLPLVSKTLRHSQVSITADLYGHLSPEAAHAAADALGGVLDAAAAELRSERAARRATDLRPESMV
ncbi:tyrosine-type recombinase/integrase [Rhodococcus aetherivorans]|uniref:tyrosine-type recombinase/integrase n=1 Tax=Rhodococcus aetherivorans TaxID=191292 RepID=UPI0002D246F7|nr:tyrosine-type recombinase/integrase [Rhodococcus aetherivorans]CCW12895.1 phage integrase family protein [Rhodococcus aetherivorans]